MASYNFNIRASWAPGTDTVGLVSVKTASPLTLTEHDETHKYLYTKCAVVNLNDATIVTPANGDMFLYNSTSSKWRNKAMSGDGVITTDGALTISKIGGVSISLAGTFSTITSALSIVAPQAQTITMPNKASATLLDNDLTSAYIYVGSAGNVATGVAVSGVIAIDNTGLTSFVAGSIQNADIAASGVANIAWNKLATGTASRILGTDGSGYISILDTATYPSLVELAFLKGVTGSPIQTQFTNILNGTTPFSYVKIGDTKLDGGTSNEIQIYINSANRYSIKETVIEPTTTATVALGSSTKVFSALYIDSIVINGSTISGTSSDVTMSCDNLHDINIRAGGGGDIALGEASDQIGFYGATPVAQSAAYTFTNYTDDRGFDCDAPPGDAELADVVATLIKDLIDIGILQGSVT